MAGLVQFLWSVLLSGAVFTCALYDGQIGIQLNMAEPTLVIFSP